MAAVGNPAGRVVLDCPGRESTLAELVPLFYVFKRGHMTFGREPALLLGPQ